MNKIVELLIDWDNQEFDELGISIMSLVEKPAIQIGWQAFAAQEFVDKIPGESKDEYIGRCIPQLIGEGFEPDEAAAICYGSFQEEVYPEGFHDKVLELARTVDFGTMYDPHSLRILDLSKEEFVDVQDALDGLAALDALGNILPTTEGKIMYRYTGRLRPNSRGFCLSMIGLNKMYTAEELATMGNIARGISSSLYPGASGVQNGQVFGGIGQWKGGPNCGHYWEKLEVFPNGVARTLGRADGDMGTAMRDMPNNGYRMSWAFADEEQMIITGPAMVPDQMIVRKDDATGEIFHVFFSKDTVKKIAQKFIANKEQNKTDINHNEDVTEENTLIESWIVEDPNKDKSSLYGFNVPQGTWMVSYKINNQETWQKIKNGELNGYSVQGDFIEKIIK